MYGIILSLNNVKMHKHCPTDPDRFEHDLIRFMATQGFVYEQRGLYLSNEDKTSVDVVLAIQALFLLYNWLPFSVDELRMLEITKDIDLIQLCSPDKTEG